jgi:hypothetical protein
VSGVGALALALVGVAVVTAAPASAAVTCGSSALVAVGSNGSLNRWPLTISGMTPSFGARTTVNGGSGWNGYRVLASQAAGGDLYGIGTGGGNLGRHTWSGSGYDNGATASNGWTSIDALVSAGDGVMFGRQSNGALRWYRWLNDQLGSGWAAGSGTVIGSEWSGFSKVFGGGNGIVYAVRASDGALLWYRNRTPLEPDPTWEGPQVIGSSWGGFTNLTSVGGGHIFATTTSGALVHYQNSGYLTGAATWTSGSGHQVGSGWTGYTKLVSGPIDCGRTDPPTNVRAYVGGSSIALRWNPPAGASAASYRIYRNGVSLGVVNAAPGLAYVNTARYVDTTAVRGTAYTYTVAMTTTSGAVTDQSATVTSTLPAVGSTAPTVAVIIDSAGFTGTSADLTLIRQTLVNWYPKLVQQFSYGSYSTPTTINVNFAAIGGGAQTSGTTITIGTTANYTSPNFPGLVLHEATHILQQYPSGPFWVAEGFAVYATHTIYNDANTPFPSTGSNYTDGYSPGAYLIKSASRWAAASGLPREINVAAHNDTYSDAIFVNRTGRSPAQWWSAINARTAIP